MTAKTKRTIVRLILTAFLLWGVYSETGKWTLIFAILITLTIEIEGAMNREQRK